jgi:hypothetical protein
LLAAVRFDSHRQEPYTTKPSAADAMFPDLSSRSCVYGPRPAMITPLSIR